VWLASSQIPHNRSSSFVLCWTCSREEIRHGGQGTAQPAVDKRGEWGEKERERGARRGRREPRPGGKPPGARAQGCVREASWAGSSIAGWELSSSGRWPPGGPRRSSGVHFFLSAITTHAVLLPRNSTQGGEEQGPIRTGGTRKEA
jgi:hypothetical protein